MALLKTLVNVHDVSILRGALPLLTPLLDDKSAESQWVQNLSSLEREAYLKLVFSSFTAQSVALLSDKESDAGSFVRKLLNGNVQSLVAPRLRELLLERLASDVFGALPSEAKVAYFGIIVQGLQNVEDSTQSTTVKAALKRFELDVTSLILVIDDLSKPLHETTAQPKKQKQDGRYVPPLSFKEVC
jgi:U3 small nucleolar RNA-associated protein 10